MALTNIIGNEVNFENREKGEFESAFFSKEKFSDPKSFEFQIHGYCNLQGQQMFGQTIYL
jgi:hypothetical protein